MHRKVNYAHNCLRRKCAWNNIGAPATLKGLSTNRLLTNLDPVSLVQLSSVCLVVAETFHRFLVFVISSKLLFHRWVGSHILHFFVMSVVYVPFDWLASFHSWGIDRQLRHSLVDSPARLQRTPPSLAISLSPATTVTVALFALIQTSSRVRRPYEGHYQIYMNLHIHPGMTFPWCMCNSHAHKWTAAFQIFYHQRWVAEVV